MLQIKDHRQFHSPMWRSCGNVETRNVACQQYPHMVISQSVIALWCTDLGSLKAQYLSVVLCKFQNHLARKRLLITLFATPSTQLDVGQKNMFGIMRLQRDVSPWCRKRLAPINHRESEDVSNKCSLYVKVVWRNLWLPSNNFLVHQGCTTFTRN